MTPKRIWLLIQRGKIEPEWDDAVLVGVQHCYLPEATAPGSKSFHFVNPDFFRLVPWEGEGLKPSYFDIHMGFASKDAYTAVCDRFDVPFTYPGVDRALPWTSIKG